MAGEHGFETITSYDHRAWLWVVTLLSAIYSLLCLAARLTGKWELLFWDDAILGLAYVFAFVHYGTLVKAIHAGLGASTLVISPSRIVTASKFYFVSRISAFTALCFSKLSVLVFTRRIFSGKLDHENICFTTSYICIALYGFCAVLLGSAGCRPSRALIPEVNDVCSLNTVRWSIITAFDVCTEICLIAIPVWFLSENKLKASKKRVVIYLFSFRLLVAAFSIAATVTYFRFLEGYDTSIGLDKTVAWQEILVGFSLISASIPCLRTFLWSFMSTGLMTNYGTQTTGIGSPNRTTQDWSVLASSNPFRRRQLHSHQAPQPQLRPEDTEYRVNVRTVGDAKASNGRTKDCGEIESSGSVGTDRWTIHRDVEFDVERS